MAMNLSLFSINFLLRVPNVENRRALWIKAIETVQKFDITRQRFNVCMNHFQESDFIQRQGKQILKPEAVPSVFISLAAEDSIEDIVLNNEINVPVREEKTECESCGFLSVKISELEEEIFSMKLAHETEKQKLERKIYLLENIREEMKDKLCEKEKELKHEKLENIRMKDILTELRNERYISEDDEKFLNVCFVPPVFYDCTNL